MGTKEFTNSTGIEAKRTIGSRLTSLFTPCNLSDDVENILSTSWNKKLDVHIWVASRENKMRFGMSCIVLYDRKENPLGFVFLFKATPRISDRKKGSMSTIREAFIKNIVNEASESSYKKLNEVIERENLRKIMLQDKMLSKRVAPVVVEVEDPVLVGEETTTTSNSSGDKKKEKVRKNTTTKGSKRSVSSGSNSQVSLNENQDKIEKIKSFTRPFKYRRVGVYATTPDSPKRRKLLLSSKGVFDIHGGNAHGLYNKCIPVIDRNNTNERTTTKELKISFENGKNDMILHLVRQEIDYKPRISQHEYHIIDGMLSLAKGRDVYPTMMSQPNNHYPKQQHMRAAMMTPPIVPIREEEAKRIIHRQALASNDTKNC